MKKLTLLSLIIGLFGILVFNSCVPETTVTPPVVTVNPADALTARPGDKLNYAVIVTSDTDLSKVEMSGKANSSVLFTADTAFVAGIQAAIVNFSIDLPVGIASGTTITVDFTAYNDGEQTVVTRTIEILAGEISTYTAVIMSDLENPDGGSFCSVTTGTVMTLNQAIAASGDVDIMYYYGAINKATLCSPTDQDVRAFTDIQQRIIVDRLTTKNNTKLALIDMTVANFTAVINDGTILAKKTATTGTSARKLDKDKVLYCETKTGKQALILVKNITGTQGSSYITIEVKVQK